jgi:hypothetical protein
MTDIYDFEVMTQSAYRMAREGKWNEASEKFYLAVSITDLTVEQRLFVIEACDSVKKQDLKRLSRSFAIKAQQKDSNEGAFYYLVSQVKLSFILMKRSAYWLAGSACAVLVIPLFWYGRLEFWDAIIILSILLLLASIFALLLMAFKLNPVDTFVEVVFVVITSIFTLVGVLIRAFFEYHR